MRIMPPKVLSVHKFETGDQEKMSDSKGGEQANILIVDDREANLALLEALLESSGAAITRAMSGQEALDRMTEKNFMLVLLDVRMPGMTGFEVAEHMRNDTSGTMNNIPIIFITAEAADKQNVFKGYESGGVDFLTKPVDPYVLISKVNIFIELWRQRRQLLQSQKMEAIGQLAGGIAHEINTPSQFIGLNLEFLTDAADDLLNLIGKFQSLKEEARNSGTAGALVAELDALCDKIDLETLNTEVPLAIAQSSNGVNQISNIVSAMKEFSHPGSKSFVDTDLNHALQNVITISHSQWENCARVSTQLDPALPLVPSLASELNQVFLNLIVNAAHAVAEKTERTQPGRINIVTQNNGSHAVITIEDDGAGIPDDVRDHIFNPFFTTKDVGEGTGQGLSISHDIIVNKHGGTIDFESKVGKGTSFIIKLPLSKAVD